jgi:hypothetical protein
VIGQRIHATLERFGLKVGPPLRQRSAHIEAFDSGAWIGAHAPGSPAHREIRVLKDRIEELVQATMPPGSLRPVFGFGRESIPASAHSPGLRASVQACA